jgi:hypothetical protein
MRHDHVNEDQGYHNVLIGKGYRTPHGAVIMEQWWGK